MEDTITITKKEYYDLRCDAAKLDMLDAGGVDNWEWHDESLNPKDEQTFWEIKKQLKKEILGDA